RGLTGSSLARTRPVRSVRPACTVTGTDGSPPRSPPGRAVATTGRSVGPSARRGWPARNGGVGSLHMTGFELTVDGIATGGDGVGRDADGRATFVAGALPGERVRVEVERTAKRHAHARLVEVLDRSGDRRTPPCPFVAAGCGG